ncbi:MAG: YbaN family protein [Chloroflexi bacterium]|nr:YbaN family protein [Chloroflexota bacterium]
MQWSHYWLLNNQWFGEYIKNYREGRGLPLREKTLSLIVLWLTIGFTTLFVVTAWWGRLILLSVAVGVTIHLVKIKTFKRDVSAPLVKDVISSDKSG